MLAYIFKFISYRLVGSLKCLVAVMLVITGLATVGLWACQVPVFRYALERWEADRYQLLIVSKGPLSTAQEQLLEPLAASGGSSGDSKVNLIRLDLTNRPDKLLEQLWAEHADQDSTPLMVAKYPSQSSLRQQIAYVDQLSADSVAALLDSPARRQIFKQLNQGCSAVWVLLESGDAQRDAEAVSRLEKQLALDEVRIQLPTAEEMEVTQETLSGVKIPLKIDFKIVRVSRQDPHEKFLISCLLNSEEDLREFSDQPIAFPVFGRGRVLYALVGEGIAADVIASANAFIVGPCSCQVKEQNPGFDLLMPVNWGQAVGSTLISSPAASASAAPKVLKIPPGKK